MKLSLKRDQVYEMILGKIRSNELPAGCKLPPEKEFAKQIGVSCRTLRTALARLEDNQLIVRLRKQGTFVAGGKETLGRVAFPKMPEQPKVQRNFQHKFLIIYREGATDSSVCIVRNVEKYAASLNVETVEVPLKFLETGKWENRAAWLKKQYFSAVIIPFHSFGTDSILLRLPDLLQVPVVVPFGMDVLTAYDKLFVLRSMTRSAVYRSLYYLYGKGHRKIGVIGLCKSSGIPHLHNVQSFELKFLCTDGFPIEEYAKTETKEEVCAAVDRLLNQEKGLTAIFCYNDFMAATVIEYLQHLGKNVPDDISVIGYDFSGTGESVDPPLTSVSLFIQERIKITVDFILNGDYRKEIFQAPEPQVIEYASVKTLN